MAVGLTDLPLYALQRVADRWLIWAPDADPRRPAVRVVAVLDTGAPERPLKRQMSVEHCAKVGRDLGVLSAPMMRRTF